MFLFKIQASFLKDTESSRSNSLSLADSVHVTIGYTNVYGAQGVSASSAKAMVIRKEETNFEVASEDFQMSGHSSRLWAVTHSRNEWQLENVAIVPQGSGSHSPNQRQLFQCSQAAQIKLLAEVQH